MTRDIGKSQSDAFVADKIPRTPLRRFKHSGGPEPWMQGLYQDLATRDAWEAMNGASGWHLTEDTLPAAIAAAQVAVVREAMRLLGPHATAEQISAEVVLPAWNVKRCLERMAT